MGAESQSVARAVDILELLSENGSLGVREIARRMDLSPTIVHRLISTLASTGLAEQAPDTQKYRIGYRAFRIGSSFLAGTRGTGGTASGQQLPWRAARWRHGLSQGRQE
jgi:DNA-binding IclR family transcriptional regulator